jgi:hypothetical protein
MGRPKRPTPEAIPLKVSVAARGALNRFDDAVRLHEMMGAYPPEEHDAIQRSYDRARLKLLEYLQY